MKAEPLLAIYDPLQGAVIVVVHATTVEDEVRLRVWLSSPVVRRRAGQVLQEALARVVERRAA